MLGETNGILPRTQKEEIIKLKGTSRSSVSLLFVRRRKVSAALIGV